MASRDMFGSRISLNMQGRDSWQTPRGGLVTMLTQAAFFYLTLEILSLLVSYEDPTIISYEVVNVSEDVKNLLDHRLVFALRLVNFPEDKIDPRAGKLTA